MECRMLYIKTQPYQASWYLVGQMPVSTAHIDSSIGAANCISKDGIADLLVKLLKEGGVCHGW